MSEPAADARVRQKRRRRCAVSCLRCDWVSSGVKDGYFLPLRFGFAVVFLLAAERVDVLPTFGRRLFLFSGRFFLARCGRRTEFQFPAVRVIGATGGLGHQSWRDLSANLFASIRRTRFLTKPTGCSMRARWAGR